MIGLNDIQNIAHKLEDIFGLIKENSLQVTPAIIDVLCKSIDYISSIVEKSIETRGEAKFEYAETIIENLEKIKSDSEETDTDLSKANSKTPTIKQEYTLPPKKSDLRKLFQENKLLITKINANIERLYIFSTDTSVIEEFSFLISELQEKLNDLNNTQINNFLDEIKTKLDSTLKGSGILIDEEIREINENFDTAISLLENKNPTIKKTEELPEKLEIKIPEPFPSIENNVDPDFVQKNIFIFSEHSDENIKLFSKVIDEINLFQEKTQNNDIKSIFAKIAELLIYSKDNKNPINSDIIEEIKKSFETAILMIDSLEEAEEDPTLIGQRLNIFLKMLKMAEDPNILIPEETAENISPVENSTLDLPEIKSNTNITPKNKKEKTFSNTFKQTENTTIKTLRVDTKKLDRLVNQVGELIIANIKSKEHLSDLDKMIRSIEDWNRDWNKAKHYFRYTEKPFKPTDMPAGTSTYQANKSIQSFLDENSLKLSSTITKMNSLYKMIQEDDTRLNLIVNELEEGIKNVRVLPLATIFHMFPRMVRDIAREKNKNIEFLVMGSETTVDKKIIEEIKSPLIHIIRNAIDHAIEDEDTRIKNGKNPTGKILLSAYHLENSVMIEISDDGKGIDIDAIKRKVVKKSLLSKEELEAMTEEQIMNIIFWPGFSTEDTISDISGRGIGLDIVYTKIAQINGNVKIKSTLGKGCKVSIQLPVTMATIKSFLVEVNNQKYAIPTSTIKTTLLLEPDNIFYNEGKRTTIVNNKTVPIYNLSKVIELPENPNKNKKLVTIIVQADDIEVGFIVDKLIGDQEILHKNLPMPLLRVKNIAGVTTLGSGELCLILNISDLLKSASSDFGKNDISLLTDKMKIQATKEKHVLIVDDSVTTRILEKNILKAAGYKTTVAINGLDALTKISSDEFDLVVTDIEMPEINGFELTERLREDPSFKDIPIILISSLVSEADKKKGLNLGANAYITKGSFNQEELLITVKNLLK